MRSGASDVTIVVDVDTVSVGTKNELLGDDGVRDGGAAGDDNVRVNGLTLL